MENKKIALVTGASAGIGRATASMLASQGWTVYGTSRKIPKDIVEAAGEINMISLDVTDPESVKYAVDLVLKREGKLDALVNNAGNGIAGALEDISLQEAVYQFDTNFFGVLNMCREALPALRLSKGIIINISSVAGVLSIPFQSLYSASKAAVELMSESLRLEVKPAGVRVCMVEPGDTCTSFTASRRLASNISPLYEGRLKASVARMEHDEQNGVSPDAVAKVVCSLAVKKNPPVRKAVGMVNKVFVFANRLLPSRLKLWAIGKLYG
jgi:NAD(P)-dependent dehydrogenase (short-subunit alcohol dehydrogenase family)